MNTFSISFLRDALIARNAFIYHGAGIAKGVGNASTSALSFLDRIRNVIAHDLEVCCSTVKFGDSEANCDFWGKIGLILWPRSPNSITFVYPKDAGTIPDPSKPGRRKISRTPVTSQALIDSIDHRPSGTANEWCLLDYEVIGLFVEQPIQYFENNISTSIRYFVLLIRKSLLSIFRPHRIQRYRQAQDASDPVLGMLNLEAIHI